ncbi:MAG TPA: YraN family protein, partial [Solirubrobacteraceae bacterium]
MPTDLRHHLGRIGEDLALAHLERLGYTLVARNHRTRHGELDLVVFDGTALVFVEVKTRRASGSGRGPWEALHERKRQQVRRMAAAFLLEATDRPRSADVRFDAIGVVI